MRGFKIKTLGTIGWENATPKIELSKLEKEYGEGLIDPDKLRRRIKYYQNKLNKGYE